MKAFLSLLVATIIGWMPRGAEGATVVNATNYNIDTLVHKPITRINGLAVDMGGVIQVGSFQTNDPSALIAGLNSVAGLNALLADFIAFGSSTSFGAQGAGFEGIYDLPAQAPLMSDNPLIGKSIYTLIGNNAALASSTELLIVKHPGVFLDGPLVVESASLLDPGNQVLFGNTNGPVVSANSTFPPAISLQFPSVPEPTSACLLVGALALAGRRRRTAQLS